MDGPLSQIQRSCWKDRPVPALWTVHFRLDFVCSLPPSKSQIFDFRNRSWKMEQTYPAVDNIQVREQFHPYRTNTSNLLGNQNRFLYKMSENYRSHHNPVGFCGFIMPLVKKLQQKINAAKNQSDRSASEIWIHCWVLLQILNRIRMCLVRRFLVCLDSWIRHSFKPIKIVTRGH